MGILILTFEILLASLIV